MAISSSPWNLLSTPEEALSNSLFASSPSCPWGGWRAVPSPRVRTDAGSFSVWDLGAASLCAFGLLQSSENLNCAGCCSCEHFPSLNSLPPCFIFPSVLLQTSFAKRVRQKKTWAVQLYSNTARLVPQHSPLPSLFRNVSVGGCSLVWATSLAKGDNGAGRGLMCWWARTQIGGNVAAVWSGFGVELLLFYFFLSFLFFVVGAVWWLRKLYLSPNWSHWRILILKYCYSKKIHMFTFKMAFLLSKLQSKEGFL